MYTPFSFLGLFIIITIMIVKILKKETNRVPSMIAFLGVVEFFSTVFQIYLSIEFGEWKSLGLTSVAFLVMMILNFYNLWFVN